MLVPVAVAAVLLAWGAFADLVLGERLYVVRNLLVGALLLTVARWAGTDWSDLGLTLDALGNGLRWGAVAVGLVVVAMVVGVLLRDVVPGVQRLLDDRRAEVGSRRLVRDVLVRIPLGTALFEELAFRGALLAVLDQATTTPRAVLWSSAVFGCWHLAPTTVTLRCNGVAPGSVPGRRAILAAVGLTAVAGVAFAGLRLASGSLLAPTLVHWAVNAGGLVVAATFGHRDPRSAEG